MFDHFGSNTIDNIISRVRYLAKGLDCKYIIIDHVSIIVSDQSHGDERRALDEIIDYQEYPVEAAKISTQARRSLGIGYIGLAHYLAKNQVGYEDKKALKLVDKVTEAFQFYLLKASNNLAKEKTKCLWFEKTKYSDGILPIDTYKKELDEIVKRDYDYDWEWLRKEIKEHGLRHSTLSAQMPSESSSVVSNATNGVEPPRDYLSIKKSKKGCYTKT